MTPKVKGHGDAVSKSDPNLAAADGNQKNSRVVLFLPLLKGVRHEPLYLLGYVSCCHISS